jgi:predicted DsbA family dithiol-disulfide isomerase
MDESRARAFLASDDGSDEVRASMAAAADHEITGVPTYVIGSPDSGPLWMVPGAQDSDVFVRVLRRAADRLAAAHQASGG